MKYDLTIILILLVLGAVSIFMISSDEIENKKELQRIDLPEYNTKIIEGCQYIRIDHSGCYVHKGNCNNPIHKARKITNDANKVDVKSTLKQIKKAAKEGYGKIHVFVRDIIVIDTLRDLGYSVEPYEGRWADGAEISW